jgi:hypothetical protein
MLDERASAAYRVLELAVEVHGAAAQACLSIARSGGESPLEGSDVSARAELICVSN